MSSLIYFIILVVIVLVLNKIFEDPKAAVLAAFVFLVLVTCAG